jgi:hypothetical protein
MGRKRSTLLVVSAVTILAGVLNGGVAGARTTTIGPGQHFVGLVNKHTTNATILMVCATPDPNETGHPLGGQTIAVEPSPTTASKTGFTGTRGRSITASIVLPVAASTTNSALTFTHYGSQTIPTSLVLPCSGSGLVVFSPEPTSKTDRSTSVTVNFGNITVDPPPPSGLSGTPSRTILVTYADSGHHYRLHIGDVLDVTLSGPSNLTTWTEPNASDKAVLRRTGGSSGMTATGTFIAKAKGKARVTATGAINCSPPCFGPILLFQVTASVVG